MGSPEKCILQGSWLVRVNENQDILKSPLVVDDVLGIENSVGSGILGKVLGKGFLTQGYFQIVFTPALIGSVQMNRPGCCNPNVVDAVSQNGEKYVRSSPNAYGHDNLLSLPRE